jgi:hypothetical protein
MKDPIARKEWIDRFSYRCDTLPPSHALVRLTRTGSCNVLHSQSLLSSLYTSQLLDQPLLLRFLIASIKSSNLGQLPFVLLLVEDYLLDIRKSEFFGAGLVDACLSRFIEVPLHHFRIDGRILTLLILHRSNQRLPSFHSTH